MQNEFPFAKQRNPVTQQAHRKQVLWQITVPLIFAAIVILVLGRYRPHLVIDPCDDCLTHLAGFAGWAGVRGDLVGAYHPCLCSASPKFHDDDCQPGGKIGQHDRRANYASERISGIPPGSWP